MKRFLKITTVTLLVSTIVAACATSPTGRRQLILLPDSQLEQMGVAAFAEMKKTQPVETDYSKQRYIECISNAITTELTGDYAKQTWEVSVFKDDTPNAFALPGGKIGVHTGMLTMATTDDQLAAVIGHEVGHVLARHGNERVSANMAVGTGMQMAAVVAGGSPKRQMALAALGLGVQVGVLLPYGRTHESEADRIGQELMARAGFDPRASVSLWQNMAKAANGKSQPEFLSTHPGHDTRIRDLNKRMASAMTIYNQARAAGKRPNCYL